MSDDEQENGKSNEIVNIFQKILKINRQNQRGKGLKILIPDQMLSRIPVSLALQKQEIIQKKFKNEIRQLL